MRAAQASRQRIDGPRRHTLCDDGRPGKLQVARLMKSTQEVPCGGSHQLASLHTHPSLPNRQRQRDQRDRQAFCSAQMLIKPHLHKVPMARLREGEAGMFTRPAGAATADEKGREIFSWPPRPTDRPGATPLARRYPPDWVTTPA